MEIKIVKYSSLLLINIYSVCTVGFQRYHYLKKTQYTKILHRFKQQYHIVVIGQIY